MPLTVYHKLEPFIKAEDWDGAHEALDDLQKTNVSQNSIAHWRACIFESEGRYADALAFMQKNAGKFNCQSSVHNRIARLLDWMGRDDEALVEINKAPIEAEYKKYPGLAIEARFFQLYLYVKNRRPVERKYLNDIPDDCGIMTVDLQWFTKQDLLRMIEAQGG